MKTISAGKFKAQCLALMDDVNETGEPVLITKRGKPVAKLIPIDSKKKGSLLGFMEGEFEIIGDIESPAYPTESWDIVSGTEPVIPPVEGKKDKR
ncbi:Prevent-host-death protein [Candidatus Koribacter versatilis Ellin345]|uniref:Antitoxin n=1 Tax=Koribacter versatilis (strain Ellin345) TaxID=204669 RepID=Q1INB2_KORVE|nr:type II toxin-antitoxin system Phd/YefM family antitoxin [Candidatus Koribacter versatilis]ABF41638.1 Prevent-host-death protein [Candidatus Koribacter versatilis Ellin345]